MKKILIGTIFVLSILAVAAFAPSGMCKDNTMEKWMQEHTLTVQSTTTYKYEQGYLLIEEIYTGEELKGRFGVEQLTKELKIPAESKAVGLKEGEEKVFVTEKITVLTSEDDPPQWWKNYTYPQWTWHRVDWTIQDGWIYEYLYPITIAWRNVQKCNVKAVIEDEDWYDYTLAWPEYVYDPDRVEGWILGDSMATEIAGVLGRDHVLLWQMSDGNVVANTHRDKHLPHVPVYYFDEIEKKVADYFYSEWRVYEHSYYLANEDAAHTDADSDGWCTQITEGPWPATWYVDDDGGYGVHFTEIQDAINAVIEGDAIIVKDGIYEENVIVNKSITLRGEDRDNTIVDGNRDDGIVISAEEVKISDFSVTNGHDGIKVYSNGSQIENCIVYNNYDDGIQIDSIEAGVDIFSKNKIIDCYIYNNHGFGICLYGCPSSVIQNNIISNNFGGIYLFSSSNSIIKNNNISNNRANGIELSCTSNSTIANNAVLNNSNYGVSLYDSSNNSINTNNVSDNDGDYGIYLDDSSNNKISNNKVSNNERGVSLDFSSNNLIYLNDFINNTYNANSYNSTNIWNSTENITYPYNRTTYENYLGNYWDDYVFAGNDTNKDGIGDTPYLIDSDKDNYPLVAPWENYFKNWPMFRHDARHTGYSNATAPDTNVLLWSYETGDIIYSSPAVANGKVFVGSYDNKIYCLDVDTGKLIWSYLTGGDVRSSPAVANRKVFVGSYDGKIYCLDEDTGELIWSYQTGDWVQSSPALANGKVFVGSFDNKIYCLDEDTGKLIWSYKTGDWVVSSPAVADEKIFVGSSWPDERIYCLDEDTGKFIWSYKTGNAVCSSPAVANGKVFVGSCDYKIYCLDEDTGKLIWSYKTGEWVQSSPALANGKVFVGSYDGKIYCLDEDTGNLIWSYKTGDWWLPSSPAIADRKVFVGSDDGKIYCLDEDTGNLIWSYETGNDVDSSPAVANGKVFVGSNDGKIYCFGEAPSKTIYVDDDFVDNPEEHKWDTVQEGINDTNDGDAVYVYNGLYVENVVVDKSITLQGEDRDNTIIDGGGNGDVVYITADGCEISGFTVRNSGSGDAGIYLIRSYNNVITNNNVSNNDYGIYLWSSGNNRITSNSANSNKWDGIRLYTPIIIGLLNSSSSCSSYNNITSNVISNNQGHGINILLESDNNLIYHNNLIENTDQACDKGYNNSWDNGPIEGGNYWSDHECEGNPSNGSQPYYIEPNGVDHYPFQDENGWLPNGPYNNIHFGEIAPVLIGQYINFVGTDWGYVPVLIFGDPDDDEIAGDIYIADSYNHFDTSVIAKSGAYYVNLNHTDKTKSDAILYVATPAMYLDLKVGNDSVSSIIRGTPLRIAFTTNLDANDLVDLRVMDPGGIILKTNPADPTQKFDNIKVSKLLEYRSMKESKQINTTGWDLGTYTFYVRTEAEHAQGLDMCSATRTLTVLPTGNIFDTGSPANPYPSIMGNHTGTIKPNHTVIATKLYTYPCTGTGGHTEYARIWNLTWNATATWKGYIGDWHNITFDKTVVLLANETYDYTIRTGSYPQIHHKDTLPTANGWINCTKFTDANGKEYNDGIPAIRLE